MLEPLPADATLLLYFTSGPTLPKLVERQHLLPVGRLSTILDQAGAGDVHLNVAHRRGGPSTRGRTSSRDRRRCHRVPLQLHALQRRGADGPDGARARDLVLRAAHRVARADPVGPVHLKNPPRKTVAAGEPLNPESCRVKAAWGTDIRDGFRADGVSLSADRQHPGHAHEARGPWARALPGYDVVLIDPEH
ncbi:hypothetical protein QJS66_16155 [Kocuria rhizophila]|nr:hypothetical protein QJS66_16155 [Kocuria rhizophila]